MATTINIPGIRIDGYNSGPANADTSPPAAAIFDKGVTTAEGAQQAADARREHSRQLSSMPTK